MKRLSLLLLTLVLGSCGSARDAPTLVSPEAPAASPHQQPTPGTSSPASSSDSGITLKEALDAIGAKCQRPLSVQSHCTWHGFTFSLEIPSDWERTAELRARACDEGYINPAYLIATDGETWFAAGDYNADTRKLAAALRKAGFRVELRSYCD